MSRPRHWWHGNVCRVIAAYPHIRLRVQDMERQKLTASFSGMPHGGGSARSVEDIALRTVSSREYSDYIAVGLAIDEALTWADGKDVLDVVRLYDWERSAMTFELIAYKLHISERTARRMHGRFVYCVAKKLGYTQK